MRDLGFLVNDLALEVNRRPLRSLVREALEGRLAARGFRRADDGIFLLDVTSEVLGWVGIPLASRKRGGEVDADPMVGIRYQPVEELVPAGTRSGATVIRPLYELLPDSGYQTWSFSDQNLAEQADAVVQAIESYAHPLMESLTTENAIEEALRTWAFADMRRRRLPALLLSRGDREGAQAEVDRERSLLEQHADPLTVKEYDAFASELLARLHDERRTPTRRARRADRPA